VTEAEKFVVFHGMKVSAGWPDRVKAAQEITSYDIGGKGYPRIAYGDESGDWGADERPCHDCGVVKGQFHVDGCDVEQCPKCGGQSIACDCSDDESDDGRFDFHAHREKALNAYLLQRPYYEEACMVAKNILRQAIERSGIKLSSIDARAKEPDSFGRKAMKPSETNPALPKYLNPLAEITDLAGVRIITFFPDSIARIDQIISDEFHVLERSDKGEKLHDEERFGYQSIHYLVNFSPKRSSLAEYVRYAEMVLEIQVRTILQHAWAEIEHDIQYKSTSVIPREISRRFNALAGMLEIADREFQAVQDEDNRLRQTARQMIKEGEIDEVEITPDALKAFLAKTMGADQRIRWSSYDYLARALRQCGFKTLRQLEDCMRGYDDDELSQLIYGFRQGPILRCELVLLASMGELFVSRHPWSKEDWFQKANEQMLGIFKGNNIEIRNFDPLATS
jgi:putative GTP pyrophosphokinase